MQKLMAAVISVLEQQAAEQLSQQQMRPDI